MKKMNRCARASRLLVFLLCILLVASMLPSFGALGAPKKSRNPRKKNNSGNVLTVELSPSLYKLLPKGSTVEFTLYKIGDPAPDPATGWRFNSDLTSYGNRIIEAKRESPALVTAITDLADAVVKTDSYRRNGIKLTFSDNVFSQKTPELKSGIYLGVLTKAPEGLTATPSLITMPGQDEKTKQWLYSYSINIKGSYKATPTASVKPTASVTPSPTTTTPTGDVPQQPAATPVPTIDLTVTKKWDDGGNAAGQRPGSIQITVDGSPVNVTPVWSKSGDVWTCTFRGLPKYDDRGKEIQYTIREDDVPAGYTASAPQKTGDYSWEITNTYRVQPEYTEYRVTKTWNHKDNKGKHPYSVTIRLKRVGDNVEVASHTLTAGENPGDTWEYVFKDVLKVDEYGKVYEYYITEELTDEFKGKYVGAPVYDGEFSAKIENIYIGGGSTPTVPTGDGETPPPGGATPNVPQRPEDIPERQTGTPVPKFEDKSDEELEELFDIFGYGTPLYGILGTGDYIPVWVWACAGVGVIAVILFIAMGRKKKNKK